MSNPVNRTEHIAQSHSTLENLINQCMKEVEDEQAQRKQGIDKSLAKQVLELLPEKFKYKFRSVISLQNDFHKTAFYAKFLTNLSSAEEAAEFVKSCATKNQIVLRIRGSMSHSGHLSDKHKYVLKSSYRCQHNTRSRITQWKKDKRSENTNCPFLISIKILKENRSNKENTSMLDRELLGEVEMEFSHNHQLMSLQALSYRDVDPKVKEEAYKLFEQKYTPSLALAKMQEDLRHKTENTTDYELQKADRSVIPRRDDMLYLYKLFTMRLYGGKDGTSILDCLQEKADEYNKSQGNDGAISFRSEDDGEKTYDYSLAVVIVTPLMSRVHKYVRHAGELVFMDSTSNVDEKGSRFFMLCTHSAAGGLPLAVIITNNETEKTLTMALELLKKHLPEVAFYGRGKDIGPLIFLTDNNNEERSSLHAVWPSSVLLLCLFHVMEALWRWLYDKKNNINEHDRQEIIQLVKEIVYAPTEEDLEDKYAYMVTTVNNIGPYDHFLNYFDQFVWVNRKCFCKAFLNKLPVRSNTTQNYVESQFRVLKDEILHRVKGYNLNELLDTVTGPLDNHFQNKLLNVANGSFDGIFSLRFKGLNSRGESQVGQISIVCKDKKMYSVQPSPKTIQEKEAVGEVFSPYLVDMEIGFCTCPVGQDGSPCKHQYAVVKEYSLSSQNFLPMFSALERQQYAMIARGNSLPLHYYLGLQERMEDIIEPIQVTSTNENNIKQLTLENEIDCALPAKATSVIEKEEVNQAIDEVCVHLKGLVERHDDQNLYKGIMKFRERVLSESSISQLSTGLHCFKSKYVWSKHLKKSQTVNLPSREKATFMYSQLQLNAGQLTRVEQGRPFQKERFQNFLSGSLIKAT